MIEEESVTEISEDSADNADAENIEVTEEINTAEDSIVLGKFDGKTNNEEEIFDDEKFEDTSNRIKENKEASIMTKYINLSKVLFLKIPKF